MVSQERKPHGTSLLKESAADVRGRTRDGKGGATTGTLISAMKRSPVRNEPELAVGWTITTVEGHLNAGEKDALIEFISRRYEERFLDPIRTLRSAPRHSRGYGFAIMALCSLLIEGLQSYRYGLPTTNAGEFGRLASFNPPPEFEIPPKDQKSGTQVFSDFFSYAPHQRLFPNVDGLIFYRAIRNGLLHQAQTKDGWRIKTGQPRLWNSQDKIVDRQKFSDALNCAFNQYVEELNVARWDENIWLMARRKIWWLIRFST